MFDLTNGKLSTKAIQVMITNEKERIGQNECIKKLKWYDILVANAKKCKTQQNFYKRQQRASDDQVMQISTYKWYNQFQLNILFKNIVVKCHKKREKNKSNNTIKIRQFNWNNQHN